MTDDIDHDDPRANADDVEIGDARAEIARLARTEGLRVAYSTSISIARDEKAPAAARGAAARTLLEIAGMLNQRDRAAAEAVNKDPTEMTSAELHAAVEDLRRRRLSSQIVQRDETDDAEEGSGVFD